MKIILQLLIVSLLFITFPSISFSQACTVDGDCDGDECCTAENVCADMNADGDEYISLACGGDDCDDFDSDRYPGNAEVCDVASVDEDCNPDTLGFRDQDGDGYSDAACCNENPDFGSHPSEPEYNCGLDCNDTASNINIEATEACNNLDDDCNGAVDDNVNVTQYMDMDSDGYGMGAGILKCPGTTGYSLLGNDCDDDNVAIKPGAMICDANNPNMILVCDEMGGYVPMACVDECVPQPNGTGYCQQKKVKKAK